MGLPGPRGEAGPMGPQGQAGAAGERGEVGPVGPQGQAGAAGERGAAGPMGSRGPAGPQGVQGEPGTTGAAGAQGPAGSQGPAGPQGPMGAAGSQGVPGVSGLVALTTHSLANLSPGQVRSSQSACPGGLHVLSGGFDASQGPRVLGGGLTVLVSTASGFDASGLPTAWTVTVANDAVPGGPAMPLSFDLAVTAVCATTN